MKIAFHTPQIDVRGTCVSVYDYAHYNEVLLGGKSVIITKKDAAHDQKAMYKFAKRFDLRMYENNDVDSVINDCDILYMIKYGKNDGIVSNKIKTCIHCVFDLSEPHGDVYAAVSSTLAKKFNTNIYVPHMIGLKPSVTHENLREELSIPKHAVVFGRHGGQDTFDLDIAKKAIINAVRDRENLYFIFVNTPRFVIHPRIRYLDTIVDHDEKNRFIMSCDCMIHAQSLGETFGIAIGEFSVNNKPVVAYNGPVWNDNYKHILGEKGIWYTSENECYDILMNFNPENYKNKDLNCYKEYLPENVMSKFKEVFLST